MTNPTNVQPVGATLDNGYVPSSTHRAETTEDHHYSETKSAFLTTEFWVFAAAVAGVLIASKVIKHTSAHDDYFQADRAWFYVVLLTMAYMVSRGLAKAATNRNRGNR